VKFKFTTSTKEKSCLGTQELFTMYELSNRQKMYCSRTQYLQGCIKDRKQKKIILQDKTKTADCIQKASQKAHSYILNHQQILYIKLSGS